MGDNYFYSLDGPLDPMPASRQMRIANLSGFPELVRSRGADPIAILERHGINPQFVRDPDHFVDCKSVVDLFEYCSSSLNDPLFGLHLAKIQNPDVFGCVAALCRAAATVRESIVSFIDYIPVVHAPDVVLELVEGAETAEIRWRVATDLGSNRQANYQAALLDLKLLQLVGGTAFRPSYVNLAVDARPRDIAELEARLGCRFNRTKADNAIAFPAHLLDQSVDNSSRLLFNLIGGYLGQVKSVARSTIAQRVQDYIRGSLSAGTCSIERCARQLGISVRTLQLQLGEAGLRFSDLLEQQRIDTAKACLTQKHMTLDEVAALLGYTEQSSFGRAFKRWTGVSPRQFRQHADRRA
jgi:AraC-like DNA-binding protein